MDKGEVDKVKGLATLMYPPAHAVKGVEGLGEGMGGLLGDRGSKVMGSETGSTSGSGLPASWLLEC